jgi:hypothetical protein
VGDFFWKLKNSVVSSQFKLKIIYEMAGVYIHIRKDKNEPFYVGIYENKYRPFEKTRRNDIWDKIVSKTEFDIKIIREGLTWDEACQMERDLIKQYGRINLNTGILANLTDGGDGAVGLIRTEEHCNKISESLTGKIRTEESKSKQGKSRTGLKDSDETKLKKSLAKKGKRPNNFGKNRSQSAIEGTRKSLFGNLHAAGEKNSKTNLTTDDVIYIKKNWDPDSTEFNSKILSQKFNISMTSVWAIATNRRWRHVVV